MKSRARAAIAVVVLAAMLTACASSPSNTSSPADTPFASMTQGTCFDTGDGTIAGLEFDSETTPADCADTHHFEYLGAVDYSGSPESEFGRIGTDECIAQYADYVGAEYDPKGYYNLAVIIPDGDDIEAGQTDGYCFISGADDAAPGIAGSAKDTRGEKP